MIKLNGLLDDSGTPGVIVNVYSGVGGHRGRGQRSCCNGGRHRLPSGATPQCVPPYTISRHQPNPEEDNLLRSQAPRVAFGPGGVRLTPPGWPTWPAAMVRFPIPPFPGDPATGPALGDDPEPNPQTGFTSAVNTP